MKLNIAQKTIVCFLIGAALGCGSAFHEGRKPNATPTPAPKPEFDEKATLGWDSVSVVLTRNRCNVCHKAGNKTGVELDTYQAATSGYKITQFAVESGSMPKGGLPPVSDRDRQVLNAWINQGLPKDSETPIPKVGEKVIPVDEVIPPVDQLDFAAMKRVLFTPYCTGCHQNFNAYEKVNSRADDISMQFLLGEMPQGGIKLPKEVEEAFDAWVKNGMPETLTAN